MKNSYAENDELFIYSVNKAMDSFSLLQTEQPNNSTYEIYTYRAIGWLYSARSLISKTSFHKNENISIAFNRLIIYIENELSMQSNEKYYLDSTIREHLETITLTPRKNENYVRLIEYLK